MKQSKNRKGPPCKDEDYNIITGKTEMKMRKSDNFPTPVKLMMSSLTLVWNQKSPGVKPSEQKLISRIYILM